MRTNISYNILILALLLALMAGCGSSNSIGTEGIPLADNGQATDTPTNDGSVGDLEDPQPASQEPAPEPTPEPKQWSAAEMMDSGMGSGAWGQKVAADGGGNTVMVWLETIDGYDAVMANMYKSGLGWEGAIRLDSAGGGSANGLEIAAGCDGHAIVVWHKLNGSTSTIYAITLDPSAGWSDEVILVSGGFNPSVSMSAEGNAAVVWQSRSGSTYDILGAYHSASNGWSAVLALDNSAGTAANASVVFLSTGDAVAVWQQYIDWTYSILSSTYDSAAGSWSTPVFLESDYGRAMYPYIAADKTTGSALAVWNQDIGSKDTVMASVYDPTSGWGEPYDVASGDAADSYDAVADFDSNGNAIVIWYNYDGGRGDSIMSAYYSAATGWGAPVILQSGGDYEYLYYPKVKFTPSGKAIAVWNRYDGECTGLMMAWYRHDTGWAAAERVGVSECDCGMMGEFYEPQLTADCMGNITLTWCSECYYCWCGCSLYAMRFE